METINRKEKIKDLTIVIRTLKNEIKEMQRKQGYVSNSDYKRLFGYKEESRYLNIIHSLMKRKVNLNDNFSLIMESIKDFGIETHWKDDNEPNEYAFKEYLEKYNVSE